MRLPRSALSSNKPSEPNGSDGLLYRNHQLNSTGCWSLTDTALEIFHCPCSFTNVN